MNRFLGEAVLDEIASAKISKEKKLKAIDDIVAMVKDDDYGSQAHSCLKDEACLRSSNLGFAFVWGSSRLGHDFWQYINERL